MIHKISVVNYLGETLDMELRNPEKSGFLIYNMDGLSPSKATINSTEISTYDGSVYNSARVESRNIVLYICLLENRTIEESRHRLYRFFPIKKKVRLYIVTDTRECYIDGYVESNEVAIFTKQEGAQISIICPDPYFYSVDKTVTSFYSIEGGFEFPFSNESLTEPLIEFGSLASQVGRTVYYKGDSEVGMLITMHMTGSVVNPSIYSMSTNESMKIISSRIKEITGDDILTGDDIIISTVRGEKYIRLLRKGKYYNILNALDRNADWFQLAQGDNLFAYTADSGASDIQFRIENNILYEGV